MAIGDKKVLVTQTYADSTFDRKDNITDDVNLYDTTKRASAKAVADLEDRIEALESGESSPVNGTGSSLPLTKKSYIATAGQTTFLAPYKVGYADVYLNGIRLADDEFTAINGTSVILETPCELNDIIQINGFNAVSGGSGGSGVSGGTLDEFGDVTELSSLENPMALTINKYMKAYQQGVVATGGKAKVGLEAISDNNFAEIELKATSGTASKTQLSAYAHNFKFVGLPTTTPSLPNMIHNSGGLLQITSDVSVPSPLDGQILQYNEALGLYVPNDPATNVGGGSEIFKAKRYIEVVAVHQSMPVLNMDSIINGIYNVYQGNIINIGAYTSTGTCDVQLMIDGVAAHVTPISTNSAKTITPFNIPVIKDTVFSFKTTGATVATKGLVLFIEIEETVTTQQSLITRYIQCPAVHKLESILDSEQVINSLFCPYRGLLVKVSAYTNSGTCTLKTKLNGVVVATQAVTSTRTSLEVSQQVFRLDSFDFETVNSSGTGLVIILTIEEM